MIVQTFLSKRPVPVVVQPSYKTPWFTPQETQQAMARKITPAEFLRRDELIRLRAAQCPYKAGDTVFPVRKEDYQQYGAFVVSGVLNSYKDTAVDYEWSKQDNPLIVTIKSLKDMSTVMFCSSSWLVKTNIHLSMEEAV